MANGTTLLSGRDEALYVSDTAPVDGSESDPTSYTKVGLLTENGFSSQREEIRGGNKDQTMQSVHIGDGSFSVDVQGERPVEVDEGQEMLEANHEADPVPPLYFLILSTDDQGTPARARHGQCKVSEFEAGSSNNEIATFSATLAGHHGYTRENLTAV